MYSPFYSDKPYHLCYQLSTTNTHSLTSLNRCCRSSSRLVSWAMAWCAAFTRFTCRVASSSRAWHLSVAACTLGADFLVVKL